jgi:tetratricopeptide (TPR) repeat protein
MELVKGIPITKYCDEHHLTPRQRLELFVPVCQAVQHAHQKGIIHRDLKPSNVLIALYDGRPVPKVIDFGVAKAAGQSLTDRTLVTGFGAVVGTLEYMSPEQAETNQLDIDTRSDIYSLGVLLYELLTGSTPFSKKDLEKAGMLEMLRVIREQEPSKPSTKLSTAEGLPTLAANRGTEPAKLTKLMRGELDWIVMKALEKDRGRRYETANGFAMDVQRYLADEAVQACPPSARYRFRKFARRNKVGLAVAALVLFFLVLLGSGVGWAVRDRAAREAEEARLQKARQVKVASEVEPLLAEVQRLEKEQKWGEALIVARRAAAAVAGGEAEPSTAEQVQQMLRDLEIVAALEKIRLSEVYTAGAEGKATAHHAKLYAAAFRDFGVDVEALPPEESAARLRSRPAVAIALAAALDEWARTGRKHDPDQSKRLWSLAAAVDPDAWRVSVRRASAAMDVESLVKLADAPDTARQPPQSQFLLAMTLELCDRHEQALALLERASEVYPGDFWIHYQLAWLNGKVRPARLDAAMHHIVAARALRPHSAGTWSYLGVVMMRQQKLDQAVAAARRATELDPKSAGAYSTLGLVLREQKKLGEAIAACRRAIELDPKLSVAHVNLGYALHGQKKWVEAVDAYRQAIELNPKYAMAYNNLGVALRNLKKIDEAIGCYRKAIEFDPNYPGAYRNLGSTLYDQGKSDEAIAAYRSAVRIQPNYEYSDDWIFALVLEAKPDEAVETLSELVRARPAYAYAHWELGKALQRQKKLDEAIDAYRKAVALDPKPATYRLLGAALHKQKKLDEAVNVYGKAIALGPNHVALYTDLGDVLVDQQKFDEAVDTYRKAIEL